MMPTTPIEITLDYASDTSPGRLRSVTIPSDETDAGYNQGVFTVAPDGLLEEWALNDDADNGVVFGAVFDFYARRPAIQPINAAGEHLGGPVQMLIGDQFQSDHFVDITHRREVHLPPDLLVGAQLAEPGDGRRLALNGYWLEIDYRDEPDDAKFLRTSAFQMIETAADENPFKIGRGLMDELDLTAGPPLIVTIAFLGRPTITHTEQ
jgi:hypothetical protein